MSTEIHEVNLIFTSRGEWLVVRPEDESACGTVEPYPFKRDSGRALLIDGRYYVLAQHVEPGIGEWSEAAADAAEAERDALLAPLTPAQRALVGAADWEPLQLRRAKRAADDADAEVRALEARGADPAEVASARADAQAKREALTEARGR